MLNSVTEDELVEFRRRVEREADLVEDMAERQIAGLESLRSRFLHHEFHELVQAKRDAMNELAAGREAMRPLANEWIRARAEDGLSDPEAELALDRLRHAFEGVRRAEDEMEAMATAYLAKVGSDTGSVEDRIRLHRSWT